MKLKLQERPKFQELGKRISNGRRISNGKERARFEIFKSFKLSERLFSNFKNFKFFQISQTFRLKEWSNCENFAGHEFR